MTKPSRRAYKSPLRAAQADATRERLLEATYAILRDSPQGIAALNIARVAEEAEVSVPTVYRHFGDTDALLAAFFVWIRPQLGLEHDRLFSLVASDVADLPGDNFPRFEEHGAVLRALMDSRDANRVREGAVHQRAARGAEAFRELAPDWPARDLEAAAGIVIALQSPQTWRWLRDTWGIDADSTSTISAWAIRSLVEAIRTGDPPLRPKPSKSKRSRAGRAPTKKAK